MKTDMKLLSDYLTIAYSENQNLIRLADTKANIVLVLIGVILSLFFNFFRSFATFSMPLIIIVIVPFLVSGYFAFLTLYPRAMRASGRNSLLYFKDTLSIDANKLLTKMKRWNNDDVISDYLNNTKSLAVIIEQKFKYLRYSYTFLAIAVLVKLVIEGYAWFF